MTIEEIRSVADTHVVLLARCPGKPDLLLFESGTGSESARLTDTACELMKERLQRAEMSQTIWKEQP